MKILRFWIAVLIFWLIFLFNIERLLQTVDIKSYTYIFVALVAIVTVTVPHIRRASFSLLLILPLPIFLLLKALVEEGDWYENLITGNSLPLTVTQLSAIVLTGLLARQINRYLNDFEDVVSSITFHHIGERPRDFLEEQGAMYREVQRARRYQRPLAVIAFKVADEDIKIALPEMIKEVQQAMMKEFVLAGVARLLNDNLYTFDTIALRNDFFIAVLPETSPENIPNITRQLEKTVKEKLKVKLNMGAATFPQDGVTFETLIEQALQKAKEEGVNHQAQLQQPERQVVP